MAPIRVQHVVSFSSQDPGHPVDNLLRDDLQPWLSSPRDRSRQLKVELQLERANHIAYIDVGNSGSAFLQIDVGRSSWPSDRPFVPLLPTTTLMSPADSRLQKNGTGVRMFKEGDLLAASAGERWDRLRVAVSQPFHKQAQFGLSFLRVRSTEGDDKQHIAPPALQERQPPALSGEGDTGERDHLEERIKEKLQRVMPPSSPRSSCLSRTARMVLSAAQSRKRRCPAASPPSPPIPLRPGGGQCGGSPVSSGSCPETSVTPSKPQHRGNPSTRGSQRAAQPRGRGRRPQRREPERRPPAQLPPEDGVSCCPICTEYFPADVLPVHASSCGEVYHPPSILLSSSDDDSWDGGLQDVRDESMVVCPLCTFRFRRHEIEQHASTCGEL